MVACHDGPAITKLTNVAFASVDHRFDGEDHSGFKPLAGSRPPIVEYLRFLMEAPSDAMATELSDHRKSAALRKALNGVSDVTQRGPGPNLFNPDPHRPVRDLAQSARRDGGFAHAEHSACVAMKSVFDDGDVDIDDVSRLQNSISGDTVAHLVIDRGAYRLREGCVARRRVIEGCRNGALHTDHIVVAEPVKFTGGDSRANMWSDEVEHFARQTPGDAHRGDFFGGFELNGHGMIIG